MHDILNRAEFEGELRRRSMKVDLTYKNGKYEEPAIQAIWVGFKMALTMMDELKKEKA